MNNNRSGSGESTLNNNKKNGGKKGVNFTMACNEMVEFIMNRKNIELSPIHYRIFLYFLRSLQGWGKEEDIFSQKQISLATGTSIQKLSPALNDLVKIGIITMTRVPKNRSLSYGFNKTTFGRVLATDEPSFTPVVIRDKLHLNGNLSFTQVGEPKVITLVNRKSVKLLKYKRNSRSKDILKKIKDISLSKFEDFLKVQPRTTKVRWERFLANALRSNPGDGDALLFALDWVHEHKKDPMGMPIRASIIALFENTEWEFLRDTLISRIKKEGESQVKEEKRLENARLIAETRQRVLEGEVDTSNVSPLFKRFADKGNGG